MTTNLTEENDEGHWIKAIMRSNGKRYKIVNMRNGYTETFQASKPATAIYTRLQTVVAYHFP